MIRPELKNLKIITLDHYDLEEVLVSEGPRIIYNNELSLMEEELIKRLLM